MDSVDKPVRLFIALPADAAAAALEPVRKEIAAFSRDLSIVPPHQYHVTIRFLGQTDADTARGLIEGFSRLIIPASPLSYAMKGLGIFPGKRRPRVIWCGLECDTDALQRIVAAVETTIAPFGFPPEARPFTPHLTVARVRANRMPPADLIRFIEGQAGVLYGESRFDRLVLFRSELAPGGARHTAMATVRLE